MDEALRVGDLAERKVETLDAELRKSEVTSGELFEEVITRLGRIENSLTGRGEE